MKSKSDLKRKVLCSLLAASTMGIFYSSDALAAKVNDVEKTDGVITDEFIIEEAGSGKFVIGQGNLDIQTDANVNIMIGKLKDKLDEAVADNKITPEEAAKALQAFVGVYGEGQVPLTGVVGGELQYDENFNSLLGLANIAGGALGLDDSQKALINKIANANTAKDEKGYVITDLKKDGDINIIVGNDKNSPVIIGAVGGDMSVGTGLNGELSYKLGSFNIPIKYDKQEPISITRNGNVNLIINNGNVLGGVGGSAAVSVGNINAQLTKGDASADINLDGKTTTTLNGSVTTNVSDKTNLGAFANGGGAIAVGGEANSIVTGDTTLNIIGGDNVMKGGINGLNVGVAGGGAAVSTIGGTANSSVDGSTTINAEDALVIGMAGGGVAGAVDATGAVELIKGGQIGNDDGTSDITVSGITVTVNEAIQGGNATATTGDTNINLTGNTTAMGVIGGGIAAASHTYTWKGDKTFTDDTQTVNDAYGSSTAIANSGKATIVIDLESADPDNVAANIGGALSGIIGAVKDGDLSKIDASGVVGQGAAVGVFGGGVAFGQGSLRGTIDGEDEGAYAVANNKNGADIYLLNGYAAGVFGGGAAGTENNAKAETNTGVVNTYVGEGMKAVGLFGGGFAVSMEGEKGDDGYKGSTNGTLASSNVTSNNMVIDGDVDGLYGGGMAIGNSILNSEDAGDAATHVGTTNITVNNGTIDRLQLISIMNASKNDNQDGYVQWNSLGINASMAMADLKGITDETSIAAGGMGMGMTGSDTVDVANITINGGEVTKDILGGGIAVDNIKDGNGGAHVGESTITLNGGTVGGSIYAGGAVNGTTPELALEAYGGKPNDDGKTAGYNTETSSTVDKATVVLNGTEVAGEISGQGYELTTVYGKDDNLNPFYDGNSLSYEKEAYDSVGESTLVISGNNTLKALDEDGDYTGNSKIHSFNNINVEAGSVTTLDSSLEAGNTVAVIDAKLSDTENGVITVADGAKLDISKLTADKDNAYLVASNFADSSTLWGNDALVYDRTENYAEANNENGNYSVSYKDLADLTEEEQDKAVNDFVDSIGEGGEELKGNVEGLIRNGENTFAGAKDFFSEASSTGDNSGLAAMAMIGEAAGVSAGTISVAGDMADNSVLRLSFTQDDVTGQPAVNEDGAVWAKYIHNKHDLDGMASSFGSIDSSSDFDGATIGVDFAKKGKVQSGIAFSYGDGDSHGMGVNNDFDMWGVTLYGNVKNDDTNVIADIGFSESDNELKGNAMGKAIKADRDVSVFTVGVRAEKLYTEGSTQIVPYTGLRYYSVDPDSYTAYYDGAKFGEYDADRQNIWTLPVGVSLRNETVTENGWKIVPQANVAYIWAFGDTDNSFDLNTGSGVSTLDYTVMDSGSWLGSLGIEAGKDDWNFGVGYSYQKGSHAEANKWFVNVEYSF